MVGIDHEITKTIFNLLPENSFNLFSSSRLTNSRLSQIKSEFASLQKSQWLKIEEMQKIQLKKLRATLFHAYNNIPFYRRKFKEAKITLDEIKSLEDVSKIPIIEKEEVKKEFPSIISPFCTFYRIYSTSGSTGKPLRIPLTKDAIAWRDAALQTAFSWIGFDPRTEKIMGISLPPSFTGASINISSIPFRGLKFLASNRLGWFPSKVDERELLRIFFTMSKFKPKLVRTFPYILSLLLDTKKRFEIDFPLSLKYFSLSGETFPKKILQKKIRAEIFNQYGANAEAGPIAAECSEHSGLHVHMENHILEIVRDNDVVSEGEKGEVIITDFTNSDFPLIRYNMEDISEIHGSKCSCGRELIRLKELFGRKTDLLVTADGKIVNEIDGVFRVLGHHKYFYEEVKQFQVIQNKINAITVLIVPDEKFSEKTQNFVISQIKKLLGEDVRVEVKLVKSIPHEKKFRYVISKLRKIRF